MKYNIIYIAHLKHSQKQKIAPESAYCCGGTAFAVNVNYFNIAAAKMQVIFTKFHIFDFFLHFSVYLSVYLQEIIHRMQKLYRSAVINQNIKR